MKRSIKFTFLSFAAALCVAKPAGAASFAYIGEEGTHTIQVVNTTTNETVGQTILFTQGQNPKFVEVSPDGTRVYALQTFVPRLAVIDTLDNQVLTDVPLDVDQSNGMVLSADGKKIYFSNADNTLGHHVAVYSLQNDTPTFEKNIDLAAGVNQRMALNHDGSRLYLLNTGLGIVVIDTANDTVVDTIGTINTNSNGLVFHPSGDKFYVTDSDVPGQNGQVRVVDAATHAVLASLTVGELPIYLAITPDGKRLYVSNRDDDTISVIDTEAETVVGSFEAADGLNGFAAHPSLNRLYVPSRDDAQLRVFDTTGDANQLIKTINFADPNMRPLTFGKFIGPELCGNGRVEAQLNGEACDDGNALNTDACLNTCVVAQCGDGFVQADVEECDDGNAVDDDDCSNQCQENHKGDGGCTLGGSGSAFSLLPGLAGLALLGVNRLRRHKKA